MSKEALKLALEALGAYMSATDSEEDAKARSLMAEAFFKIQEALAQPEQCQCPNCRVTLHASDCAVHNEPAYPTGGCDCGAQQGPEFFTHNVEQPYDWSEWVCPNPKRYLMKCCDCGLVHEAEFGVVRYKSETEREDCDRVDDPNLQAVFRMRRSEQWSPEDTAHRAGGLPMEQQAQQYNATSDHQLMENAQGDLERIKLVQTGVGIGKPEQEPVAYFNPQVKGGFLWAKPTKITAPITVSVELMPLYTTPPQRSEASTWFGLTDEEAQWLYDNCRTPSNLIDMTEARLKDLNT